MRLLVVYASRYGSTRGIAERIAQTLSTAGHQAATAVATKGLRLEGFDACVIGSAVYMGSWLNDATELVRRNEDLLRNMPVWLFSSGPLGTETKDAQGCDVRKSTVPKQIAEFELSFKPRGHRVFFGAFDHIKLNFAHRMVYAMPAAKQLFTDGDFRDWDEIDAWATGIAEALTPAGVSG